MNTDEVLAMVKEERARQEKKWGEQNHDPYKWITIISEELGESARQALELQHESSESLDKLASELIQVSASAVAAVECLNRGLWKSGVFAQRVLDEISKIAVTKSPFCDIVSYCTRPPGHGGHHGKPTGSDGES